MQNAVQLVAQTLPHGVGILDLTVSVRSLGLSLGRLSFSPGAIRIGLSLCRLSLRRCKLRLLGSLCGLLCLQLRVRRLLLCLLLCEVGSFDLSLRRLLPQGYDAGILGALPTAFREQR